MPHRTPSTRNDYEREINNDWPYNSILRVSFYLFFCLNLLTMRLFPSERQTFIYVKVIIKTKRTQMPHGDTELRKPQTQSD